MCLYLYPVIQLHYLHMKVICLSNKKSTLFDSNIIKLFCNCRWHSLMKEACDIHLLKSGVEWPTFSWDLLKVPSKACFWSFLPYINRRRIILDTSQSKYNQIKKWLYSSDQHASKNNSFTVIIILIIFCSRFIICIFFLCAQNSPYSIFRRCSKTDAGPPPGSFSR